MNQTRETPSTLVVPQEGKAHHRRFAGAFDQDKVLLKFLKKGVYKELKSVMNERDYLKEK